MEHKGTIMIYTGRVSGSRVWMENKYCPQCGTKYEYVEDEE